MTSTETVIHIIKSKSHQPGPDQYKTERAFGSDAPKFTIKGRPKDRQDETPGPQYQALKSTVGEGPKFSFHGRPKDSKLDQSPGPDYVPPAFGKGSQASSFHMRKDPKTDAKNTNPGPGEYVIPSTIGAGGHKYTMKARVFPRDGPESAAPGPSAYTPNYDATMPKVRQNTIGSHLTIRTGDKNPTPGPGEYVVPSSLSKRTSCFHSRRPEEKVDSSPGPAAYEYQSQIGKGARKCIIHDRIEQKTKTLDVPINAIPSKFGTEGRKTVFHARTEMHKPEATSGPDYVPPAFGSGSAKYSFGNRRDISKRTTSAMTPGPGAYDLGTTIGKGKRYTMRGREKAGSEAAVTPGPADYVPDYDKLLKGRRSEIGRRLPEPKSDTTNAGFNMLPEMRGPMITIGRKDYLDVVPGKNYALPDEK
ncbi:hypothetical protein TVAG_080980 [Trichomonas vaginalis G3]|uniref:Outer dense fiber protein 3 n=1 Tax=Trichomonas vaginalis (strain ATCC PRA-98 / G3) TaxID=412133 RepID=A2EPC1_TRIV3|nr:sperm-tail PG-rich repeat family [Trichomonas vaginalis G3]EAY05506.1 hypothetical protein TVAG_080980 [Trichomonas vaginalis G3]KAI5507809.1 sperm-tail PG-rich repeat family [Trichomonas vaginalis G3]|eukprot:XP_001317729.1 hypothetical protein [Trichomonas vaginalis G3]